MQLQVGASMISPGRQLMPTLPVLLLLRLRFIVNLRCKSFNYLYSIAGCAANCPLCCQGIDIIDGGLLFACTAQPPTSDISAAAGAAAAAGVPANALDPNWAQAFNLRSRPASVKKLW
jgi:hypothetical protein